MVGALLTLLLRNTTTHYYHYYYCMLVASRGCVGGTNPARRQHRRIFHARRQHGLAGMCRRLSDKEHQVTLSRAWVFQGLQRSLGFSQVHACVSWILL